MSALRRRRFEAERFEYLKAGDSAALLRLAGRWRGHPPDDCVLLAVDGDRTLRLEPLPATPPGPGDGLWRAAYPATLALVDRPDVRFALETVRGPVRLPRPVERDGKPAPTAAGAPAEPRLAGLLERTRDARVRNATQRRRQAERALSRERAARLEAERSAQRERARFETTVAEARDTIARASIERGRFLQFIEEGAAERARLERDAAELRREAGEARSTAERAARAERELSDAVTRLRREAESARELAAARGTALRKVDRRIATTRDQLEREKRRHARFEADVHAASEREVALLHDLDEARGEAGRLRTRVSELEAAAERLRTGLEQGGQRLVAAERLAEDLKARVADVLAQPTTPPAAADPAAIAALREDLERRAARLVALEHQAVALRDAIRARVAAHSVHEGQRELVGAT